MLANPGLEMDQDPPGTNANGIPTPGNPYTLGQSTCLDQPAAGVPDVPWAPVLPVIGIVAAGALGIVRRRRNAGGDRAARGWAGN